MKYMMKCIFAILTVLYSVRIIKYSITSQDINNHDIVMLTICFGAYAILNKLDDISENNNQ